MCCPLLSLIEAFNPARLLADVLQTNDTRRPVLERLDVRLGMVWHGTSTLVYDHTMPCYDMYDATSIMLDIVPCERVKAASESNQ